MPPTDPAGVQSEDRAEEGSRRAIGMWNPPHVTGRRFGAGSLAPGSRYERQTGSATWPAACLSWASLEARALREAQQWHHRLEAFAGAGASASKLA